jgi:orotate phosphoribosyltransferase
MAVLEAVRNDEIESLRSSLLERALKLAPEGETFTLASGRETSVYFDTKPVILAPEQFCTIGKLFWKLAHAAGATAVGGLAAGAIPIAMAIVAYDATVGHAGIRSFYVRDERKSHGTKESLYQAFDPERERGILDPTSRVVVVDDVLTTGKSIERAVEKIRDRGGNIESIIVLVDRLEGGASRLQKLYGVPVISLFRMDQHGNLSYSEPIFPEP